MELCAELWSGVTAIRALTGVFRDPGRGMNLWDKPVLVQCYADKTSAENRHKLGRLIGFMKRMCRDANQAAVACIIAGKFYTLDSHSVLIQTLKQSLGRAGDSGHPAPVAGASFNYILKGTTHGESDAGVVL